MKDKLIIYTPENSDDYGAFSDCETEKSICAICCGDATKEVTYTCNGKTYKELVCKDCLADSDYMSAYQIINIINI